MPIQSTPEGSAPMPVGGQDEDQGPEQGAPEGGAQANPVIDALKTIQTFIAAQKEKGNPKAQALIAAFQQLVGALAGGAGGAGPKAPMPPSDEGDERPRPEPMGRGQMPMGASRGSVPIV